MKILLILYLISTIVAFIKIYCVYEETKPYQKLPPWLKATKKPWHTFCHIVGIIMASLLWPITMTYLRSEEIINKNL